MIGETPQETDAGGIPSMPQPASVGVEDADPGSARKREAREIGGRDGPDPTRYGDWEKNGRCIDF
jgi:hypothetical protein